MNKASVMAKDKVDISASSDAESERVDQVGEASAGKADGASGDSVSGTSTW